MFKPGAKETGILQDTVLFNLHNYDTVKAYARNSLYYFEANNLVRLGAIWLTEWK